MLFEYKNLLKQLSVSPSPHEQTEGSFPWCDYGLLLVSCCFLGKLRALSSVVAACVVRPTEGKAMGDLSRHPSYREASLLLLQSCSDSLLHYVTSPSHGKSCHDTIRKWERRLTRISYAIWPVSLQNSLSLVSLHSLNIAPSLVCYYNRDGIRFQGVCTKLFSFPCISEDADNVRLPLPSDQSLFFWSLFPVGSPSCISTSQLQNVEQLSALDIIY